MPSSIPGSITLAMLALLCTWLLVACASPAGPAGDQADRPGKDGTSVLPWEKPAAPVRPIIATQPDKRCTADADCSVKNVGNCCGYYPACVNKDAVVDANAVRDACARSGMAGVCGFKEIAACTCEQSQCRDVAAGPGAAQ